MRNITIAAKFFFFCFIMTSSVNAESVCYNVIPTHSYEIVIDDETLPQGIVVEMRPSYFNDTNEVYALVNKTTTPLKVVSGRSELKQVGNKQFYKMPNEWKPNHLNGKDISFLGIAELLPTLPSPIAIENKVVIDIADKPFSFTVQYGQEDYLIRGNIKYSKRSDFDIKRFLNRDKKHVQYACGSIVYYDELKSLSFEQD